VRRLVLALTAALALAGGVAVPSAASAADVSRTSAVAAPDFASEVFADPWDFSNPEDMLLDNGGPAMGLQGAGIRDGQLTSGMSSPGYLSPLWGGYPGALYLGREGGAPQNRLDASRFTRFSLHAYASRDTPAGLMWFSCEGLDRSCMGGQPFALKAGWHTYDFAISNTGYGLPKAWSGPMTGLRVALSPGSATSFAVDWMRVYAPTSTVTVSGGKGVQWDVDDDPFDNRTDRPGWGPLPCGGSCDLSFLPAGTYRMVEGGRSGEAVTLRPPVRSSPTPTSSAGSTTPRPPATPGTSTARRTSRRSATPACSATAAGSRP
jgi:hypothetical protein